jgi:hypothetical protein
MSLSIVLETSIELGERENETKCDGQRANKGNCKKLLNGDTV